MSNREHFFIDLMVDCATCPQEVRLHVITEDNVHYLIDEARERDDPDRNAEAAFLGGMLIVLSRAQVATTLPPQYFPSRLFLGQQKFSHVGNVLRLPTFGLKDHGALWFCQSCANHFKWEVNAAAVAVDNKRFMFEKFLGLDYDISLKSELAERTTSQTRS